MDFRVWNRRISWNKLNPFLKKLHCDFFIYYIAEFQRRGHLVIFYFSKFFSKHSGTFTLEYLLKYNCSILLRKILYKQQSKDHQRLEV